MLFKVLDEPRGGLCPSRPFSFHLLIFTVLPVSLQGSGGDDFRRLHDPTGACLSFVLESEQGLGTTVRLFVPLAPDTETTTSNIGSN